MYADIPAAAYSAIRTTCNLIFQLNIHKQESWGIRDPEREYWQLCVFWTVYLVDQHISLSCGRPASLSDHCEGVETPEAFCSRVSSEKISQVIADRPRLQYPHTLLPT